MPRNAEEILAEAFQRREYRYLDDEPEFNLHHNEQATQHELVDDSDNMRIEQGKEEDEDSRILGHIHPTSPLLFANKLKSDRTIDTSSALNARRQLRSSKSRTIRGKSSGKRVQGKASSSSIHSAISVSTGRLSLALADSLEPTDTDVLNAQPIVDDTTAISTELNNHSAVTDASNRSEPIDVPVIAQDRDILASSGKSQWSRSLSPTLLMPTSDNDLPLDVARPTPLESLTSEEDDDEDEAKVQSEHESNEKLRATSIHRRSASYGNTLDLPLNRSSTSLVATTTEAAITNTTTASASASAAIVPRTTTTSVSVDNIISGALQRNSVDARNELTCVICCDYYQQPVRLRRCRHVFCRPCILASLTRASACPICRSKTRQRDLVASVRLGKLVDALQVLCDYAPHCRWIGKRTELEQHLNTTCQEMPVLCSADPLHPDCFEKYPRRKIDTHRRVCRWRMTPCVFVCGELFYDKRAMTLHVEQQCPNRTVNCLHCDVQHQARDRDRHLLTCPRAIIPCPHQAALGMAAGCTVRVERRDLPLHLRQCRFEDMKDVLRGVRIHLNSMLRRQRAAERRHKAELRRITTLTLHSGDLHDAGQLRGLLRFNPAIRALNAYDFQPGTSWVHLTEVLQDGNWPIHTLNLQGSVIEKTGAVLLAKALRTNKRIRHLNLTDNAVGDQGVEFLTKAFMDSNTTMTAITNTTNTSTMAGTSANHINNTSNANGNSGSRHWSLHFSQFNLRELATLNGKSSHQHGRRGSAPYDSIPSTTTAITAAAATATAITAITPFGSVPVASNGVSAHYHTLPTYSRVPLVDQTATSSAHPATTTYHGRTNTTTRPIPSWLPQHTATNSGTTTTANSSNNNQHTANIPNTFTALPTSKCHASSKLATLLLSRCLLTDKSAELLARALPFMTRLHTLDLSHNKIRHRGAEQLGMALGTHPSIRRLDLSINELGPKGVEALADMVGRNAALRELDLSRNKIGGGKGLEALVRALSPSLLRASRGEGASFDNSSPIVVPNEKRKSADFSANQYPSGLGLSTNYSALSPPSMSYHLATGSLSRDRAISSPSLNVTDLSLATNSDTITHSMGTHTSTDAAAAAAISNSNPLVGLSPLHSPLPRRTSSGGPMLSSHHMPTNTTLRTLRLSDNHIDDTGACHLARALLKHPGLRYIDVSNNRIGDVGVTELLDAIHESGRPRALYTRGNAKISRDLQQEINAMTRESTMYIDQLADPTSTDEESPLSSDNSESEHENDETDTSALWTDEPDVFDDINPAAITTAPMYYPRSNRYRRGNNPYN